MMPAFDRAVLCCALFVCAIRPAAVSLAADEQILRPFFAHVHAPGRIQVTRNHPPIDGRDRIDHATMHPGRWLAFGDMNGSDFWRNRDRVVHDQFREPPVRGAGHGLFVVRNRYVAEGSDEKVVCWKDCRFTFLVRPKGYLILWDSTFTSDTEFYFGDQEELGLGVRLSTPLIVERGGTILDAQGRVNGEAIGGNSAAWCDYRGETNGRRAGVTLLPHPDNFQPSRFHARDYGLLVANPSGRQAFRQGEPSQVVVKPGEKLRLQFGISVHAEPQDVTPDFNAMLADYVRLTAGEN